MLVGGLVMVFVAMVGMALVPLVLLVVALVDLVQRTDAEWFAAQQDRLTWLLVTLLVGLIGPVLYLAVARPRLDRARLALQAGVPAPGLSPPPALPPPPPSGWPAPPA